jgi:hypothetical protein
MDVEHEIAKLKYHVKLLGDAVDWHEHPIAAMVVALDWSEDDLDKAQDIFDKYDRQVEAGGPTGFFERELRDTFGIGYQTVKQIVLGFYHNSQFLDICCAYAKEQRVSEFREILRDCENASPG